MAAVVFGVQQGCFFAWCQIYIKIYLAVRDDVSRPRCSNVHLMGYLLQHIYCKVLQFLVLVLLPLTAAVVLWVRLSLLFHDGRRHALWLVSSEVMKYRFCAQ